MIVGVTRSRLTEDFSALGVRPGQVVMLHASVRAVNRFPSGAHPSPTRVTSTAVVPTRAVGINTIPSRSAR